MTLPPISATDIGANKFLAFGGFSLDETRCGMHYVMRRKDRSQERKALLVSKLPPSYSQARAKLPPSEKMLD